MNEYRTHYCHELRIENVGEEVRLAGWVQKVRNLGGMIFIDLRDQFGVTQILVSDEKLQEQAKTITTESSITVLGKVAERSNKNSKLKTGDIEVLVEELDVINQSIDLPFEITNDTNALEDTRLKYRYLDLRRDNIKNNLIILLTR